MRFFRGLLAESILCDSRAVQVPQSRRKYVPVGLVPPSMAAQLCSTCTARLRRNFYSAGNFTEAALLKLFNLNSASKPRATK